MPNKKRVGIYEINGQQKIVEDAMDLEEAMNAMASNVEKQEASISVNVNVQNSDDIPLFDDLPDMEEAAIEASKVGIINDEKAAKTSVNFSFVGGGQGGSNLANQFWSLGYRRILVVNTTEQDMQSIAIPKNNQFVMQGYSGAGKNPKVGYEASKKYFEEIIAKMHDCFGKNTEHIFVCIGAGGGSGTGSVANLIEGSKKYLKQIGKEEKVGVIMTMPDKSEKGIVQTNASLILDVLLGMAERNEISPLVVMDNGQISKFFPNESIANFYPKANQIVCGMLDRFNTITAYASPIGFNVDVADFKTVLSGGASTYGQCKVKEIKDNNSLCEAIVKNTKNTLLFQGLDMATASHACCLILADQSSLNKITKDAVDRAVEGLSRLFINPDVKIHLGIYRAPSSGISVYTMVSGMKKLK